MKTAEDVAEMLRLKACGWGRKRIGKTVGCSHHTVMTYLEADGVKAFKTPERVKALDGHEEWLRERFVRHRGNADVVRQELAAEKGVHVTLRTVERAVQPYRQALAAEALGTVRFETPPGHQLQIDFGERMVEIAGETARAYMFVATLGYSRRLHVRAFRNEKQTNWLAGFESAFRAFGGVPEEVLIDNPRSLVTSHDATTRAVTFNTTFLAFARHCKFRPRACAPYRARTKGKTADVGVCPAFDHGDAIQSLPYRRDELCLVVPRNHRLVRRRSVAFADLLEEAFVGLRTGSAINLLLAAEAARLGRSVKFRIQVTGFDALCLMVEQGLGIGIAPEGVVRLYASALNIRKVSLEDGWATRIATCRRPHRPPACCCEAAGRPSSGLRYRRSSAELILATED